MPTIKPHRNLDKHPQYAELAKRHDDLKYVLLTYGPQLGSALEPIQAAYQEADQQASTLAEKLMKKGWR